MISAIRRSVAILAACGLAISFAVYVGSYMGLTMDGISLWAIILHVGVFILFIPMCLQNCTSLRDRSFFWSEFSNGRPKWVVPAIQLIGLFFVIHFVLFLIESHATAPQIKDGQYVLDNHGQIQQIITQREFLHLKGSELRLFATGWMSFYFLLLAYWWFFPDYLSGWTEMASWQATKGSSRNERTRFLPGRIVGNTVALRATPTYIRDSLGLFQQY